MNQVTYDHYKIKAEAERLRKLGYPDSLIAIVEVNGVMCARPFSEEEIERMERHQKWLEMEQQDFKEPQ